MFCASNSGSGILELLDQELIQYDIATHLIVLLVLVLIGGNDRTGMEFGRIVLQLSMHRLTKSDFFLL